MSARRFRRTLGGVSWLGLHVVWHPKYRRQILGGRTAARCAELRGRIAAEHGGEIVAREVVPDHVDLLVLVGPTGSPAVVARMFKGCAARVVRQGFAHLRGHVKVLWSPSYFAASVGYVSQSTVRRYIEHQWDAASA